jgi:4-aminobutyrate aminotransferase-like enzyme
MKAQLETLVTIAPATANLARGEAAKRIVDLAPAGFSKVFFTNAGADANENAIRMARLYTGRDKVLSAYRSYHGNTGSAIAATGDWRRVPNEFSRGHVHFFNPYLYRSEFNAATEEESASARWRICGGSLNARADGHRGDPAGVHPRHRRDPRAAGRLYAGRARPGRRVWHRADPR